MDENDNQQPVEKAVLFDAVTEREQAEAAQRRTACYEGMEVRRHNQTRTLHAPDGRYANVHYHYRRESPRQHSAGRHSGYGRGHGSRGVYQSQGNQTGWRDTGSGKARESSWEKLAKYEDQVTNYGSFLAGLFWAVRQVFAGWK
jgi:hypothetical protein